MHIVKNISESLLDILNVYGKAKDTVAAREDMLLMGIRPEMAPQRHGRGTRAYLRPGGYSTSKEEKMRILQCLKLTKVLPVILPISRQRFRWIS